MNDQFNNNSNKNNCKIIDLIILRLIKFCIACEITEFSLLDFFLSFQFQVIAVRNVFGVRKKFYDHAQPFSEFARAL